MAFLIRTIDFTAAGREIIRDRVVEQDALTIGRAAENDIHLADLAVEQNHVRIGACGRRHDRRRGARHIGFRP